MGVRSRKYLKFIFWTIYGAQKGTQAKLGEQDFSYFSLCFTRATHLSHLQLLLLLLESKIIQALSHVSVITDNSGGKQFLHHFKRKIWAWGFESPSLVVNNCQRLSLLKHTRIHDIKDMATILKLYSVSSLLFFIKRNLLLNVCEALDHLKKI